MSAPQFTPGPWGASQMRMDKESWASLAGDHDLTIVRANWDTFTGDVIACVWADDDHDEMANARLIAAAPELYEADGEALDTFVKLRADLAEEDAERHAQRIAVIDLEIERLTAVRAKARGDDQ